MSKTFFILYPEAPAVGGESDLTVVGTCFREESLPFLRDWSQSTILIVGVLAAPLPHSVLHPPTHPSCKGVRENAQLACDGSQRGGGVGKKWKLGTWGEKWKPPTCP